MSYHLQSTKAIRIESRGKQDVRGAQFRSATPRAFTAQHSGLLSMPRQTGERLKAGTAMVAAPNRAVMAMVENCILDD